MLKLKIFFLILLALGFFIAGYYYSLDQERKNTQVIVLCYHHVDCPWETQYSISRLEFIKQIHTIRKAGYKYISSEELEDFLLKKKRIPIKSALITVDDGFLNAYTIVYPMLKRLQIPWTFFIYPQVINQGRKKYAPTWTEVKEMADNGVIIGCHSLTHGMLTRKPRRIKTTLEYRKWLEKEMLLSKKIIQQNIGREVKYFAPPYGAYNPNIYNYLKESGYILVFNAKNKLNNDYLTDPLNINRFVVRRGDKIENILKKAAK